MSSRAGVEKETCAAGPDFRASSVPRSGAGIDTGLVSAIPATPAEVRLAHLILTGHQRGIDVRNTAAAAFAHSIALTLSSFVMITLAWMCQTVGSPPRNTDGLGFLIAEGTRSAYRLGTIVPEQHIARASSSRLERS